MSIFFDSLQVMDDTGKWHTICHTIGVSKGRLAVYDINKAIMKRQPSVYVDI